MLQGWIINTLIWLLAHLWVTITVLSLLLLLVSVRLWYWWQIQHIARKNGMHPQAVKQILREWDKH